MPWVHRWLTPEEFRAAFRTPPRETFHLIASEFYWHQGYLYVCFQFRTLLPPDPSIGNEQRSAHFLGVAICGWLNSWEGSPF